MKGVKKQWKEQNNINSFYSLLKNIWYYTLFAFACNAKNFAIVITFFFFLFSIANVDRLTKADCQIFFIC